MLSLETVCRVCCPKIRRNGVDMAYCSLPTSADSSCAIKPSKQDEFAARSANYVNT